MSLDVIKNMKKTRNEPKDVIDVKLAEEIKMKNLIYQVWAGEMRPCCRYSEKLLEICTKNRCRLSIRYKS